MKLQVVLFLFTVAALSSTAFGLSVQISLSNSLTSNSIAIISGSSSDNALITASCTSGDTCQIDASNGLSLASGTTTATLPYNALGLGYSTIYANDITNSVISGYAYVRRVSAPNSIAITLTNQQSAAIPANAQISIAFSGHNYTSIESNTLNNSILYFKNGTVAYSWLEGGVTNNQEYSVNVLSTSANVFFWFKTPPSSSFLPANTGTAPTNTIYIGFGTFGINLMDGNFTGEAPQLSPLYAQYDNGAKIFNYYLVNPGATSMDQFTTAGSAGLSTTAPAGSYFDTPNAIAIVTGNANNYAYSSSPAFSPGNIITYWFLVPNQNLGDFYFLVSSSGSGQFSRIDERGGFPSDSGILPASSWTSWSGNGNIQDPIAGTWDKVDVAVPSSGTTATMYDTPISNTPLGTLGSASSGSISISNNGDYFGFQPDVVSGGTDYWDAVIVRDYLPGAAEPQSSSYPVSLYNSPTISVPSPYSQSVLPGESAIITDAGLLGGLSPYAYQWYASNAMAPTATSANAAEANTLLGIGTSSGKAQSQNATFETNALTPIGTTYWFRLYAADTYPTTENTTAASVVFANPSPQPSAGGPARYNFVISDNITSGEVSAAPIFMVNNSSYYQNQLPATVVSASRAISLTFACTAQIGNAIYSYQNDVYGLGFGIPCGEAYNDTNQNIELTYAKEPAAQATTTTLTTTLATSTIGHQQVQQLVQSMARPGQSQVSECSNGTSSPNYSISYPALGSKFGISNAGSGCFDLDAVNLSSVSQVSAPNFTKIAAINVSIDSTTATLNATMDYPCGMPTGSIAPYLLKNRSWTEIAPFTLNQSMCTISFRIPSDPIIAILERNATVSQSTTIEQPQTTNSKETWYGAILALAVVAVAIAIVLIAATRKRRPGPRS